MYIILVLTDFFTTRSNRGICPTFCSSPQSHLELSSMFHHFKRFVRMRIISIRILIKRLSVLVWVLVIPKVVFYYLNLDKLFLFFHFFIRIPINNSHTSYKSLNNEFAKKTFYTILQLQSIVFIFFFNSVDLCPNHTV